MDIGSLTGQVAIEDQASSALEQVTEKVWKFAEDFDGALGGLAIGAGVVAAGIAGIAVSIEQLGQKGSDINDVTATLNQFAGGADRAADIIEKMRAGVRGTIGDFDLAKDAARLLSANVKLSADEFGTLTEAAFTLQNRGLGTTKEMMDLVSNAMITGRTRALAMKLGVVDIKDSTLEYAQSLGLEVDQLTEAEKAEARRAGVMKLMTLAAEQGKGAQRDFGEQFEFAAAQIENWVDELASAVAASPNIMGALTAIGDALAKSFSGTGKTAIDAIMKAFNAFADGVTRYAPPIIQMVADIGNTFTTIMGAIIRSVTPAVTAIVDAISEVISRITSIQQVGTSVRQAFGEETVSLLDVFVKWVGYIGSAVATYAPPIITFLGDIVVGVMKLFNVSSLVDTAVEWINFIGDAVASYGPPIMSFLSDLVAGIGKIWERVQAAWDMVPDWFKKIARDAALATAAIIVTEKAFAMIGSGSETMLSTVASFATITSGIQSFIIQSAYVVGTIPRVTRSLYEFGVQVAFVNATGGIGAVLSEMATGLTALAIGPFAITGLLIALGAAIYQVVGAIRDFDTNWEKGGSTFWGFITLKDDDTFVRRWLGLSKGIKETADEVQRMMAMAPAAPKPLTDMEASKSRLGYAGTGTTMDLVTVQTELAEAATRKLTTAQKEYEKALADYKTVGGNYQSVLNAIGNEMYEGIASDLARGKSTSTLAVIYRTTTQVIDDVKKAEAAWKDQMKDLGAIKILEGGVGGLKKAIGETDEKELEWIKTHLATAAALKMVEQSIPAVQTGFYGLGDALSSIGKKSTEIDTLLVTVGKMDAAKELWKEYYATIGDMSASSYERQAAQIAGWREAQINSLSQSGKASADAMAAIEATVRAKLQLVKQDFARTFANDIPGIFQDFASGKGAQALTTVMVDVGNLMGKNLVSGLAKAIGGGGNSGTGQAINAIGTSVASQFVDSTNYAISYAAKGAQWGSVAGPYGMAAGAAIGAIIGAFKEAEISREMESIGYDYGVSISKGLAEAIMANADEMFRGSLQAAGVANIGKIIAEGGGLNTSNLDIFTKRLRDAFSMVEMGEMTLAQATGVITGNWANFARVGTDSMGLLSKGLIEIIDLSERFGMDVQAVTVFMRAQGKQGIEGFNAVSQGMSKQYAEWDRLAQDIKNNADLMAGLKDSAIELTSVMMFPTVNLDDLDNAYKDLGMTLDDDTRRALELNNALNENADKTKKAAGTVLGGLTSNIASVTNQVTGQNAGQTGQVVYGVQQDRLNSSIEQGLALYSRLQQSVASVGGTTKDALEPMQGFLAAAQESAVRLNQPLDAMAQTLINQSRQLGLWKDTAVDAMSTYQERVRQATADGKNLGDAQIAAGRDAQVGLESLGTQAVQSFGAAVAAGVPFYDALKAIAPGLEPLKKAYEDLGLSTQNVALQGLFMADTIMQSNPELIAAVGGLVTESQALFNMGQLNAETFGTMELTGEQMYTKLQSAAAAAGGGTRDALMPMQGWLQQAAAEAERLGIPLSANTQILIGQSKELGIWQATGATAAQTQTQLFQGILQVLTLIGEEFKVNIPAGLKAMSTASVDASGAFKTNIGEGATETLTGDTGSVVSETNIAAENLESSFAESSGAAQLAIQTQMAEAATSLVGPRSISAAAEAAGGSIETVLRAAAAGAFTNTGSIKDTAEIAGSTITSDVGGAVNDLATLINTTDFSSWGDELAQAAKKAADAINKLNFGSSPGGLKEIPILLDRSIDAARDFGIQTTTIMGAVKGAVDDLSDEIRHKVGDPDWWLYDPGPQSEAERRRRQGLDISVSDNGVGIDSFTPEARTSTITIPITINKPSYRDREDMRRQTEQVTRQMPDVLRRAGVI